MELYTPSSMPHLLFGINCVQPSAIVRRCPYRPSTASLDARDRRIPPRPSLLVSDVSTFLNHLKIKISLNHLNENNENENYRKSYE